MNPAPTTPSRPQEKTSQDVLSRLDAKLKETPENERWINRAKELVNQAIKVCQAMNLSPVDEMKFLRQLSKPRTTEKMSSLCSQAGSVPETTRTYFAKHIGELKEAQRHALLWILRDAISN